MRGFVRGRRDYTLNPTTHGPTNGVQFTPFVFTNSNPEGKPLYLAVTITTYVPDKISVRASFVETARVL